MYKILIIFFLLIPVCIHAASLETMVAFVPDQDKLSLISDLESAIAWKVRQWPESSRARMIKDRLEPAKRKIDTFTFDLNEITKQGWEIKSSRRAYSDLNSDGEPDSFEWGTEYTLQKKKSWWSK